MAPRRTPPGWCREADIDTHVHLFAPFQELARQLLPATPPSDGAHDIAHLSRVWHNATLLQAGEGGDLELLAAAVLLHDCVAVPKNSPQRAQASTLAAAAATDHLQRLGWPSNRIAAVASAIRSHSYSAHLPPETLEAQLLQDADRLDAIGFVGIARCFYTAGRMGSALYAPTDPEGTARPLDDARFALDHFPAKLLRLAANFNTATGRQLAARRHASLLAFYQGMLQEVQPPRH